MLRSKKSLIVLIAALICLDGCDAPLTIHGNANTVTVVDGDSLVVNGQKIRLWGLDAPELHQTCTRNDKSWHCGRAAKKALTAKIANQPLNCHQRDIDAYDRVVAECFLNDENLNAWLVQSGWALAYRRYSEKFIPEERAAKAEGQGIWQSQFMKPWEWRRQQR